MNVDQHLGKFNDALVHHYARRRAERTPSVSARIKEPTRTVELGCFLRYCLLTATDQLILMFQRRVADLWRHCTEGSAGTLDWKQKYQELLAELAGLLGGDVVLDAQLRARLEALLSTRRDQRPVSRASIIRQRLIDSISPVHSLLLSIPQRTASTP